MDESYVQVEPKKRLNHLFKTCFLMGKLIFLTPVAMCVIHLEDVLAEKTNIPLWGMCRSPAEIDQRPDRFFCILKTAGCIPKDARFVSLSRMEKLKSEPDKNETCCSIQLTYQHCGRTMKGFLNNDEGICTREYFVKFQSGRQLPLWLQAVRSVTEWGLSREVDAYTKLVYHVPGIKTARMVLARKTPVFNRVFLVLEHVPVSYLEEEASNDHPAILDRVPVARSSYEIVTDSRGATVSQVRALLTSLASMHAQFMNCASTSSLSRWIPASHGLDFLGMVESLMPRNRHPPHFLELFRSLSDHFALRPATVVHGDARPGNVLFPKSGNGSPVLLDWEAVNIGPATWDLTYCTVLGMTAEARRANFAGLAGSYAEALWQAMGMDTGRMGRAELRKRLNEITDQVSLLTLALFYLSWMIHCTGFWDGQGNSREDRDEWASRVRESVKDLDPERIAKLLPGIPVAYIRDTQEFVENL